MAFMIGFLHHERLGYALLCSLIFLSLADFESLQLPQTLDAGGSTYLATPVVIPAPLPTLYYNCEIMPAICKNVQDWLTANNEVLPKTFHIQTQNERNTATRRGESCPDTWSVTHTCPELIGQPQTIYGYGRYINGNPAYSMYQFTPTLLETSLVSVPPVFSPFNKEIQGTAAGDSSGLAFTCDEFPPASWIEGGNGANTFCAPQGVSCSSTLWNTYKSIYKGQPNTKYPLTRSEQNWQAAAHSLLGQFFSGPQINGKKQGQVGKFVFDTTSIALAATPNAAVIRFPASTKTITKRGLDHVETGFPDIPALAGRLAQLNGSSTLNHKGVEVIFVPAEQTPAPVSPAVVENVKAD
ncbi:hypothetical protein ACMFMG_003184 [Clarireedia jacksonii]